MRQRVNSDSSESSYGGEDWKKYVNSDEESENSELFEKTEDALRQITYDSDDSSQPVRARSKFSGSEHGSLSAEEADKLNKMIDEGDFGAEEVVEDYLPMSEELMKMHEIADEAIRDACIKVCIVSMSANAALLVPGIGKAIAIMFTSAAAAGLVSKLQRDLISQIADIYKVSMSEAQKEKVQHIIGGAVSAAKAVKSTTVALGRATKQLKAVSTSVAKSNQSKFSKMIPVLGPLTVAGIGMTTTFVIGKRSKKYFSNRFLQISNGNGDDDEDEIQMESWSETVKMLTGLEHEKLSGMMSDAINKSSTKMKTAAKSASSYASSLYKKTKEKANAQYAKVANYAKGNSNEKKLDKDAADEDDEGNDNLILIVKKSV